MDNLNRVKLFNKQSKKLKNKRKKKNKKEKNPAKQQRRQQSFIKIEIEQYQLMDILNSIFCAIDKSYIEVILFQSGSVEPHLNMFLSMQNMFMNFDVRSQKF